MDMGVFIPIGNNGWLISETSPQYKPSFALNKAVVQKAEGYNLEFALSMIKLHGFGGKTEFWDYNLESFTLMAGLASVTSRIKLYASTAVLTLPPALVARMATTIDSISDGRFGINIVSGWQKAEYEQMGLWPGDQYFGERYDYSSEYVSVMKELWSEGVSNFDGKFFHMKDCMMKPMPAHPIKIVAAGQSGRGMAFAAEYADYNFVLGTGVNTPTACTETCGNLVEAAAKTGRDVGAYVLFMVIADETDALAQAKWKLYQDGADIGALWWMADQGGKDATADASGTAARINLPEGAINFNMGTLVGSYASVRQDARRNGRHARLQGRHADLRRLPDRAGPVRPADPAAHAFAHGPARRRGLIGARTAALPARRSVGARGAGPAALEGPHRVEADQVVEVFEGIERRGRRLARAMRLERPQRLVDGRRRREAGHRGIDGHGVADVLEFGDRPDGRASTIGHVGHHGLAKPAASLAHLRLALQRFGEHDVGPGLAIGLGPPDGILEPVRLARVGARDDQSLGTAARFAGDFDLLDHVGDRHDPLEGRVAALFWEFLVFDLDGDDPGVLVAAHGVVHVEQPAIACIGVGDDAGVHRLGQRRHPIEHLRVAGDAGIRQAVARGGQPIARGIDEIEPRPNCRSRR